MTFGKYLIYEKSAESVSVPPQKKANFSKPIDFKNGTFNMTEILKETNKQIKEEN